MTTTEWWTQLKSVTLHVEGEPPPLWPAAVDPGEDYRTARRGLHAAERELRDRIEAVAALRRALPPGPELPTYTFAEGSPDLAEGGPAESVTLAELFGGHRELLVYHLMFHPEDDAACAMCSMWVDGLCGVARHLTQRAGLAVIAKAPLDRLRAFGRLRGWQGLRLVSAYGTSFTTDLGTEGSRGGQWPSVSVFTRDGATVRHAYTQCADFPDGSPRGIDPMCAVWSWFDLLPSGRGEWLPDNTYPVAT